MITDEMVEMARKALEASPAWRESGQIDLRLALEAVAPMLTKALTDADICRAKAQGIWEALDIWDETRLRARAQELDPQ